MVQINFAQKQVNAKIVYYGPGMSGKTTNLEVVHQRAPEANRGDLTSISTDGDRTLFFDFMPLDLGTVAGMRTCFQIYTVPGQVYYNSTRKLVLQGVDGVIFIADSSASMKEENLESMRNLEENLNEYGKSLANLPLVIQYNKRDLPDAMSVEDLNALLNPYNAPHFEGVASSGQGVFPTLKALAARVLDSIHTSQGAGGGQGSYQAPTSPPVSRAATGFHPAPGQPVHAAPIGAPAPRKPAPAAQHKLPPAQGLPQMQQPLGQTGFRQAPPMAQTGTYPVQQQPQMGQTGYYPQQQLAQTGFRQPGAVDPLARTAVHAPPPMQQGQGAPGLRMAPGGGTPAPQKRQHQPAPSGRMMQAESPEPAQRNTGGPRPSPAARTARSQKDAPRIQPRAAASPTPVRKPRKKALLYAGIFLVFALGAGAVIGRFILKVF